MISRTAGRDSPRSPHNFLTFDVEHWWSATLLRNEVSDPTTRIHESVDIVLDRLDTHDATATFFVVGEVARNHPDLVRRIAAAGHEIASHGHTHRPLFDLNPLSFRRELARSTAAIERAIGRRPRGFRAPNFSVTPRTAWAFDALSAEGYRYDSSVFPVRTPLYGVSDAPLSPYVVQRSRPFAGGEPPRPGAEGIAEFPLAVFHPRFRLPTAGGFYARLLPTPLLTRGVENLNRRDIPAMLYFHPWEFNPAVPVSNVPPHKAFVSFHGIERLVEKLDALLSRFDFGPIENALPATTKPVATVTNP